MRSYTSSISTTKYVVINSCDCCTLQWLAPALDQPMSTPLEGFRPSVASGSPGFEGGVAPGSPDLKPWASGVERNRLR
jgi:hypothetical protein